MILESKRHDLAQSQELLNALPNTPWA